MDTKKTISITEARKNLFDIAKEVQAPNKVYILTEKGKPTVAVMSAEEYESWVETMEVDRIFPDLAKDVAEADEAVRTGAYKKWPTLADLEKDWGFAVADKSKKKYGVQSSANKKGPKKSR